MLRSGCRAGRHRTDNHGRQHYYDYYHLSPARDDNDDFGSDNDDHNYRSACEAREAGVEPKSRFGRRLRYKRR